MDSAFSLKSPERSSQGAYSPPGGSGRRAPIGRDRNDLRMRTATMGHRPRHPSSSDPQPGKASPFRRYTGEPDGETVRVGARGCVGPRRGEHRSPPTGLTEDRHAGRRARSSSHDVPGPIGPDGGSGGGVIGALDPGSVPGDGSGSGSGSSHTRSGGLQIGSAWQPPRNSEDGLSRRSSAFKEIAPSNTVDLRMAVTSGKQDCQGMGRLKNL
jgi:hypothetical protein